MNHIASRSPTGHDAGILPRVLGLAAALALAGALAAPAALADGTYCSSRDALHFGNRGVGTRTSASATISNCGDAPWSFTRVSVHPSTAPAFDVATTCATAQVLAPGQSCTIAVEFAPQASGQVSGALWLYNSTTVPSQLVTFYGRGVETQAATTTLAFAPAGAAFAAQEVGTRSPPLAVDLTNLGPAALTPSAIVIGGPAAYDFAGVSDTCGAGFALGAGESCRILLSFEPQDAGARNASLVIDAPQLAARATLQISGLGVRTAAGNASEMWWNSPAGSEPGWGVNFAHVRSRRARGTQCRTSRWRPITRTSGGPRPPVPKPAGESTSPSRATRSSRPGSRSGGTAGPDGWSSARRGRVRACIRGRSTPGPVRRSAPCPSIRRG